MTTATEPAKNARERVPGIRDDALGTLDAVALATEIAAGRISALELVDAAIARLERVEPHLNATVCARLEQALEEAQTGTAEGLLAGVPSLIKDNTDLAGLPTTHGSRAVPSRPATRDGIFARQFRATGLIPLAKTTLPEFGLTATTEFSGGGATRNPWHTGHSTGGSSAGSAACNQSRGNGRLDGGAVRGMGNDAEAAAHGPRPFIHTDQSQAAPAAGSR